MRIVLFTFFILLNFFSHSQSYNLHIDSIISKVNIDTLTKYVNHLSGENMVSINNISTTIVHRIDNLGNDLAADYLIETLEKVDLAIEDQAYSLNGRNIIAVQTGNKYPDQYYIICAHYDAIPDFAADDNASGVAAVLETARILSKYDFPYSIIYALWDQEEIGLFGSRYWANNAKINNVNVKGVINLDMIGYNITHNNRFDIHTGPFANSLNLANYIHQFCNIYNLSLSPFLINSSMSRSDHKSFWDNGYSAVLLIEPFDDNLFNPYYHTDQDRINLFNMEFFHEMSKLSLGLISSLASDEKLPPSEDIISQKLIQFNINPNPIKDEGSIYVSLLISSSIKIDIISISGDKITIEDDFLILGDYFYNIPKLNLAPGMYIVSLQSNSEIQNKKLVVVN